MSLSATGWYRSARLLGCWAGRRAEGRRLRTMDTATRARLGLMKVLGMAVFLTAYGRDEEAFSKRSFRLRWSVGDLADGAKGHDVDLSGAHGRAEEQGHSEQQRRRRESRGLHAGRLAGREGVVVPLWSRFGGTQVEVTAVPSTLAGAVPQTKPRTVPGLCLWSVERRFRRVADASGLRPLPAGRCPAEQCWPVPGSRR